MLSEKNERFLKQNGFYLNFKNHVFVFLTAKIVKRLVTISYSEIKRNLYIEIKDISNWSIIKRMNLFRYFTFCTYFCYRLYNLYEFYHRKTGIFQLFSLRILAEFRCFSFFLNFVIWFDREVLFPESWLLTIWWRLWEIVTDKKEKTFRI